MGGACTRRSGPTVIALAEGQDQPQVLEEAAAAVFALLARPVTIDDIVVVVALDHGLTAPAVRRHVEESLSLLIDAGLIEAVHGRPG